MKARILGMILAGGEGSRLLPLTRDRAKPAVPFGGKYRIIDFVLSNFINSEIYSIYVLVQFKCQSLIEHLQERWRFGGVLGEHFISSVPAQMWKGQTWYQGNADAVYQNLHLIENFQPDFVAVFGADHIYRMDIRQMMTFHLEHQAEVTIAAFPVPVEEGSAFGILQVEKDGRITGFEEKPAHPTPLPHDSRYCLASMGNYFFSTPLLRELLEKDKHQEEKNNDFGRDVIPPLIEHHRVYAYDFRSNRILGSVMSSPPIGAMWVRWTPITPRAWTYAGRFRPSISTILRGQSVAAFLHFHQRNLPMMKGDRESQVSRLFRKVVSSAEQQSSIRYWRRTCSCSAMLM